jgi:hypothetical protein
MTVVVELDEKELRARSLFRLARLSLRQGDDAMALSLCRQSLKLILETAHSENAASCLLTFASVALARGQHIAAARLFGVIDRLLDELGTTILHGDAAEYEHVRRELSTLLDAVTLEGALAEGRAMTFDHAAAYALTMT